MTVLGVPLESSPWHGLNKRWVHSCFLNFLHTFLCWMLGRKNCYKTFIYGCQFCSSALLLCVPDSACPGPSNWKISVQELCKCDCSLRISPKSRLLLAWGKGCSSLEMPFHPWEVSAFLIQLFPGPHGNWTNRCQIIWFYFREHKTGWISEKHWSCAHLFLPSLGVIWIRFEPLSVFQKAAFW